jgi:hypothetical protein
MTLPLTLLAIFWTGAVACGGGLGELQPDSSASASSAGSIEWRMEISR